MMSDELEFQDIQLIAHGERTVVALGGVEILDPSDDVGDVLEMTRLDSRFRIVPPY